MFNKDADVCVPVHKLLTSRWSGVAYDTKRKVSNETLLALAEAARWAPSCFGDQPWRFIFCNKHSNLEAWQNAQNCLIGGNQTWTKNAPVLILACHDTLLSQNNKPNAWSQYDTGAAAMNLCLQAAEMKLMVHQMAGFDPEQARSLFSIPERFQPISIMAVGYQLPQDEIPSKFTQRENSPRSRNSIGDNFFANRWNESILD